MLRKKRSVVGCCQLTVGAWFLAFGAAVAAAQGPLLVPDYNCDGVIDLKVESSKARAGEAFTIWLNDDDDAAGSGESAKPGDTNTDRHDIPCGEGHARDCADETVNGRSAA